VGKEGKAVAIAFEYKNLSPGGVSTNTTMPTRNSAKKVTTKDRLSPFHVGWRTPTTFPIISKNTFGQGSTF
jgi:hypothetical protein